VPTLDSAIPEAIASADGDRLADTDAVCQPAHRDAADAVADPHQRARQGQDGAIGVHGSLDVAQPDDGKQRRPKGD